MFRAFAGAIFVLACVAVPSARAADGYRLLTIDGRPVKWGTPQFDTGVVLSYAILTGRESVSGVRNCTRTVGVEPLLKRSRLDARSFGSALRDALAMWEGAANVKFHRAADAAAADIVVGTEAVSNGLAYADVTTVPGEIGPTDRITRGIVCLSAEPIWTTRVCGSSVRRQSRGQRDEHCVSYALAHEIGHVLGLDHPGPTGELMSFAESSVSTLQRGDLLGIAALYGAKRGQPLLALSSRGTASR